MERIRDSVRCAMAVWANSALPWMLSSERQYLGNLMRTANRIGIVAYRRHNPLERAIFQMRKLMWIP